MNIKLGLSRLLLSHRLTGISDAFRLRRIFGTTSTVPVIVFTAILAWTRPQAVVGADTDYSEMPLRELMGLEVFTAASLVPTALSKAPGTVYSFDREDFTRLGIRQTDDILQFVPGFQINQYRKHHRSIWARGALDRYNDKFVLLVDGIQMRHLYYGHFSLGDNFPLEKVEKVEIILGPASSPTPSPASSPSRPGSSASSHRSKSPWRSPTTPVLRVRCCITAPIFRPLAVT